MPTVKWVTRGRENTAELFQSEIEISLIDRKNNTVRSLGVTRAVPHVFKLKLRIIQLFV